MTAQKTKAGAHSSNTLLTAQEQILCKQIAKGKAPHRQRAAALLALNQGSTQAGAGDATGLSASQVKYWVARFRTERMAIFPEKLKGGGKVKAAAPAKSAPDEAVKEKKGKEVLQAKEEKKVKKEGKKPKKGKKEKKGKKGKKGKKKAGKGKKK